MFSHPWSYPLSRYWSTKICQLSAKKWGPGLQHTPFASTSSWPSSCTGPRDPDDLRSYLDISTTKPGLPYMFFDSFWKTMESLRDITTWYYNDWRTGNMNSVSFTKTLENFDMESQKLGFRAVPTGNGNFWGTGVRCTGEEFHNRSLFSATNM